jgi:hypothetical protein
MAESPFDTLMQVSMGFTLPRTLHVIAELGIADALDETPRSAEALAATTRTDAEALNRALRLLSAHGIFERQGGAYAHTPISRLLRSDHPQSMRSFVRMRESPPSGTSGSTSITRCGRVVLRQRKRCQMAGFGAILRLPSSKAGLDCGQ